MYDNYSVLMSVYFKEKPEYLHESMESIFRQTVKTNDFVLVCDGPLNDGLDAVIREMQEKFEKTLRVVRIEKNRGLGYALNEGLKYCKNELVARMDSDDISLPERCEKQLAAFENEPELSICSGRVEEFEEDPKIVFGKRELPLRYEEIVTFSKKRNPFNHPAVMFRKTAVLSAGNYSEEYPLFEDYYLWVRMLQNGEKAINMPMTLVLMRTPIGMCLRRGGRKYARDMLRFHKWMLNEGWSSTRDYISGALPHAAVCVLPNFFRKLVYSVLHK